MVVTTTSNGRVVDEVSSLPMPSEDGICACVLLCHHRPHDEEVVRLLQWLRPSASACPLVLGHGHAHGGSVLYADHERRMLGEIPLYVSRVYSANTSNGKRRLGAANLIEIDEASTVKLTPVDISSIRSPSPTA